MEKSYIERCAEYEDSYRAHPTLFKINAFLVALFGYLCNIMPFWPFILFAAIAFSSFIFPTILQYIGMMAFATYLFIHLQLQNNVYEMVWSKLYNPYHIIRGVKVTKEEYPELYKLIKETCKKLSVTMPSEIYISGDSTSLITIRPLLRFTPFVKYILCVSFYDLYGMSSDQFQIVIMNILANLTKTGRFSHWLLYLVSKRIELLELVKEGPTPNIGLKFIDFNSEILSAISGVLIRWNIVNADNITINNYNVTTTGEALISSLLIDKISEKLYWDDINNSLGKEPKPPIEPYTILKDILKNRNSIENADEIIREDLSKKTRLDDNTLHMFDRLEVISYFAAREGGINSTAERLSKSPDNIAADIYIVDNEDKILTRLNANWYEWAALLWEVEYNKQQAINTLRQELDEKIKTQDLTLSEKWEYIEMMFGKKEEEKLLLEKLHQFVVDYPCNISANLILGSELLRNNNPEGLSYIENAISYDPEIEVKGLDTIITFHMDNGREMEADLYIKRLRENIPQVNLAIKERNKDLLKFKYIHHDLTPEWLETIKNQLSKYSDIKEAYMVKVDLKYIKERPIYLFFYTQNGGLTNIERKELYENLNKNLYLPSITNIYLSNDDKILLKKTKDIGDVNIYTTKQETSIYN
jgi:hypothetical protein